MVKKSIVEVPVVRVEVEGALATVTVGTGERHNALTAAGWQELADRFGALAGEAGLAAVVVRGAGGTFCSGSDVTEWLGATPEALEDSFARMEAAFRAIEACPVPVVAQIAGYAAGAGCQLALACDLRVIGESARIGMPIARLGILPSPAFAGRLVRLSGPAVAAELLHTGRLLDARRAVAVGLANLAVPDPDLAAGTRELIADIVRHPPAALRAAKQAVTAATAALPDGKPSAAADYPSLQFGINGILRGG
jgi:enoyl-CoA hydratase/carnithine racemase